jgi:hypothetical protein
MIPHTSGTSLSAQARYAAGVREILECWFDGRPIREGQLIVQAGALAGAGAHAFWHLDMRTRPWAAFSTRVQSGRRVVAASLT